LTRQFVRGIHLNLEKARRLFADAIKHRPRIRLTIG
jgi:hypothetical protein